jgi:RNA polymerase sigma-70 factor (ECF subfamily)
MSQPGEQPAKANTSLTLLQRARANESGAWERLVGLYAPLVRHWCGMAGLQPTDVEDVTQEVFLTAAANLGSFRRDRPGDTFRGWLRTLARNCLATVLRRQARQPVGAGGTEAQNKLQELADPNVELPEADEPAQIQGLYRRALELVRSEFEERTWQMFWLSVVEERPAADVAAQFGVSAAAVRKARSRVLHRLKQEVGDAVD